MSRHRRRPRAILRFFFRTRFTVIWVTALLAVALLLLWGPTLDFQDAFARAQQTADHPLTIALLILAQALFTAFALPATLVMWLVAPFHPPLVSTVILLAGSLPGVWGAYLISRRLGGDWRPKRGAWLIDLLARRSDFLTQCALRVLPGYPHWALNYTAGVLKLPLRNYLLAAVLGLTVKWWVYSAIIHGASTAVQARSSIPLQSLLPLLLLATLLVLSSWLRQRLIRYRASRHADDSQTAQEIIHEATAAERDGQAPK